MKKFISFALATVLTFSGTTAFAGTIPKVNINNNKILLQNSPFIENGNTYIPLRAVSENLGAAVTWDAATQTATIKQGIYQIEQRVNADTARVNSSIVQLSAPAVIREGVTYVPARFITETLGGELTYNPKTNVVNIEYEMPKDGGQQYDPYGRLIRTTNLPSNAGMFEYILNGVPNAMYEMPLAWYRSGLIWKTPPVEGKDYIKPINLKNHEWGTPNNVRIWKENLEKNLDLRLNVDYRTVNESWIKGINSTNYAKSGLPYYVEGYTKEMQEYINYMKANHLVIEGDYYVEPSTTYLMSGAFYMRVWYKFRINSDKVKTARLYQEMDMEVTTNQWYTGYVDISNATNNMGSDGSDIVVCDDNIIGIN